MRLRHVSVLFVLLFPVTVQAALHIWTGAASDRFSDAANWEGSSAAGPKPGRISFTPKLAGGAVKLDNRRSKVHPV